jgi:hypothetical protein
VQKPFKVYKERYYSLGEIFCVSLKEKVYFNNYGFNHLIRRRGLKRPYYESVKRLNLLVYVRRVITSESVKVNYRKSKYKFWSLSKSIDGKSIKIVLRKKQNGKLHFYSIFEE